MKNDLDIPPGAGLFTTCKEPNLFALPPPSASAKNPEGGPSILCENDEDNNEVVTPVVRYYEATDYFKPQICVIQRISRTISFAIAISFVFHFFSFSFCKTVKPNLQNIR